MVRLIRIDPEHRVFERLLLGALLVACLAANRSFAAESDPPARWNTLPIDLGPPTAADGGWKIGGAANPQAALPIAQVRGRWIRFSATVDRIERGLGLRINASSKTVRVGSIPALCDGQATMSRCSTVFWMPDDADRANVVAWADNEPGDMNDPLVEIATIPGPTPTIGHRVDSFIAQVRDGFYLADQVDWPDLERTIAAIPAPPDDVDPTPAIAQFLRARLPGNKHMFVWTRALTTAPAASVAMPSCGTAGGVGVVVTPGLAQISGDAPAAYASALHDCLMQSDNSRVWVVDLRGNSGGNMDPMIGGLAPLLPIGRLYAFANGRRAVTAVVGLDERGVTINHQVRFPASDAGKRIAAPVIVMFGAQCGSSCEQTANALAARPRTLFVGEPSAGYLTANVPLPIDDAYILLLTTGYTQDPCGRIIEENLAPDVNVAQVGSKSIDELLELPDVRTWLAARLSDHASDKTSTGRCQGVANSSG